MATAAQRLSDALVRHQIEIERLKKGTAKKFIKLLQSSDAGMVTELRRRLDRFGATGSAAARKVKSLEKLITTIVDSRRAVWIELRQKTKAELKAIAAVEAAISADLLEGAVGLDEFKVKMAPKVKLGQAVGAATYQGLNTAQHLKALEMKERSIIQKAIRQGVFDGMDSAAITRAIVGTSAAGLADGAMQAIRRNLGTLIATAVNSATAIAREEAFKESGVITGLIWTATLDGRTTPVCQSRDGHGVPFNDDFPKDILLLSPPAVRPPAHFNCRSYMEAVLRDVGIVKPHRVAVTDSRTEKKRRIDFRAKAKAKEGGNWKNLTERQRRRRIREMSNQWARANIGTVAPQVSYPEWLGRQSARFQDSVLGPTRGKLFRSGGLKVSQFVDETGRSYTLPELESLYPGAFKRAGV